MNVLQSNIQDAIRLSGNATFGNSYKSEKLAPDNANQKCQDLLMILKEEMKDAVSSLPMPENGEVYTLLEIGHFIKN
jgi:hypothetical protein